MTFPKRRPPRSRKLLDYEFQRAYRACIPCRERKVKCQPNEDAGPEPCARCSRLGLSCVFSSKVPWSRESKDLGGRRARSFEQTSLPPTSTHVPIASVNHVPQQEGFTDTPHSRPTNTNEQTENLQNSVLQTMISSGNDALNILFEAATCAYPISTYAATSNTSSLKTPPASIQCSTPQLNGINSEDFDTLRIWNACRFVKMGWFTAYEAMTLVDLFFVNMSNQFPVLTDFYSSHANQYWLVAQEPMLCCTVLAISSRYHVLPGSGGKTRALFIHHRLWQHCQHLLLRLILGQEKASKAKTRNVGTIEALLLIVEWYPLSVHFPPDSDGWDSDVLLTMPDMRDPPLTGDIPALERWKRDVIEPTKRSEQMSWMVLSSALALSHEVGIFDRRTASVDKAMSALEVVKPDAETYTEHMKVRRERLPQLLFCFINLMSSRLGCTSFMCPAYTASISESDKSLNLGIDQKWQSFMNYWAQLTTLSKTAMDSLFPLITADDETEFQVCLNEKQEALSRWYTSVDFESCAYKDFIFIEYQYFRVLINSTGMQRVITRHTRPHLFQSTNSEVPRPFKSEHEYGLVEGVIDGCCHIIEIIIGKNKRDKSNNLHYAPIRMFSRMISASIFLLKALGLGVRKIKLTESLNTLDSAILALQNSNLDDIHLAAQYGELLKIQVDRLRKSFKSSAVFSPNRRIINSQSQEGVRDSSTHFDREYNNTRWPLRSSLQSHQPESSSYMGSYLSHREDPFNYQQFRPSDTQEMNDVNLDPVTDTNTWDKSLDDWFSLPFDPTMAPFTGWDDNASLSPLNPCWLDVDFIWNLPP